MGPGRGRVCVGLADGLREFGCLVIARAFCCWRRPAARARGRGAGQAAPRARRPASRCRRRCVHPPARALEKQQAESSVVSEELSEARAALATSEARADRLTEELSEARDNAEAMRREMRNLAAQVGAHFSAGPLGRRPRQRWLAASGRCRQTPPGPMGPRFLPSRILGAWLLLLPAERALPRAPLPPRRASLSSQLAPVAPPSPPPAPQMEATERLLAAEQSASTKLRAGSDALASDLAAAKAALAKAQSGLEREQTDAAQLRAQLEAIKGGRRGGLWAGGAARPGF